MEEFHSVEDEFNHHLKLANEGSHISQMYVSYAYQYGRGVKKCLKSSKSWIEKSDQNGNAVAKARKLVFGWGVEKDVKKSFELLTEYFQKERDKLEEEIGYVMLGFFFHKGQGVEKDLKRAFEFYRKSAKVRKKKKRFWICFFFFFFLFFFFLFFFFFF